mgnify:CR=1 FL=1
MKQTHIKPTQLIAMIDYPPLHSPEAFFGYYQKLKADQKIEPTIIVPTQQVISHFKGRKIRYKSYAKQLESFLATHPTIKFFMLGGKHRSAAAAVLGLNIPCLIVKNDRDIIFVHNLKSKGKLTGGLGIDKNFEKTLKTLEEHFFKHKRFWTMNEKTKAMIEHGDIPKKMAADVIIKKSRIGQFKDGLGVFANKNFKKGETVIKYHLKILTGEEYKQLPNTMKYFTHKRKGIINYYPDPERHVNRSKNPNVYPDFNRGADIALRDIKKGEELSIQEGVQEDF